MSSLLLSLTGHGGGAGGAAPAHGLGDLVRLMVVLAIAASGVVFSEPAPVDLIMFALIALLPLAGLQTYSPALVGFLMLWLACGAGAIVASAASTEVVRSTIHTGVSFYLYIASFVLAAFVANRPCAHAELILKTWVAGALIAAAAGLVGYFQLVPGAGALFTKFGRAAGTFKDPNVLGPFLIPAILYMVHRAVCAPPRTGRLPLAIAGLLSLAVLLSFSRGAWINLAVAAIVYGYLLLVTAGSAAVRRRLLALGAAGALAIAGLLLVLLQIDSVADLMAERASLDQGYDVGPEGRFGGHEKAKALILDNPLGIGATQFATHHHHEDVHNVYLAMFLNAGWLGGMLYCAVVGLTLLVGLGRLTQATRSRPLLVVAFAALVGNIVEGVVIDTDHWRHFYVLLAIVWGLAAAPATAVSREAS